MHLAGAGATRWKDTSCQAPSPLGSLIIPLLSPFTLRMCRLLPAGISLRYICGIIPATPCLERYLELTEMLINDSAGRWDSRSPSSHAPGALFELRAELQAHIQHPEALCLPQLPPLLQG